MLVEFRDNIGRNDSEPLGLDFAKCLKGTQLEVSEAVGAQLITKRLATEVSHPKSIKGVPGEQIKAVPPDGSVEKTTQDFEDKGRKFGKNPHAKDSSQP